MKTKVNCNSYHLFFNSLLILLAIFLLSSCGGQNKIELSDAEIQNFAIAKTNGETANQGYKRCFKFVQGWLQQADPETGLIPRNLNRDRDIWNARDSAADNYPFMVLTTALLDRPMFNNRMMEMLQTETRLTSRIGNMPDTWSFSKDDFTDPEPDMASIFFGSSEYIKDGLLPLTEWLGHSPWSDRMIGILDDMWKHAPVETPFGNIVSTNVEVNGEMLQTLSRIYWMTGQEKYLEWAIRLGDYYLLGTNHPTKNLPQLRLRDHGCEIVSGLCELYATMNFARPEKKNAYQGPVHEMLDRILEVGRNEHGLFYNSVNPLTGEILNEGIADTWGYTYNGFYTVYLIDKTEKYREATLTALRNIYRHYLNFDWENDSADGYADAIESALNLFNREAVPDAAKWMDSQIKVMWNKQQPDGIIEGWHGDGNFARTTIMYCLWKSQGVTISPWREDIIFGAVADNNKIYLTLLAEEDWDGTIIFDKPRHAVNMNLPLDWPRINQFPEWFTVNSNKNYKLSDLAEENVYTESGSTLSVGLPVKLNANQERHLIIE